MNELVEIWERPGPGRFMIAGWQQWADAGSVSSGLPRYLIERTRARRIGAIRPNGFYLFQIPGTHHLLRPMVKLEGGHVERLQARRNEFFYADDGGKGFVIFLGEEPHANEEGYASAFFDVVEELAVKRVAVLAGVYAPVPYEKDREISCAYSLPRLKEELADYVVRFSDYEGGATIGMHLARRAEDRGIEFVRFTAMVPAYDFSKPALGLQAMTVGEDFKAWYDIMVRLKHMFDLGLDLADLEGRSRELISGWDARLTELAQSMPQLGVEAYMEKLRADFTEQPFVPLSKLWEEELDDLFEDGEEVS